MTLRARTRNYRSSPTSLARAGGAKRRTDSVASRREALESGAVVVPEGSVVCPACFRVVRIRESDGEMRAHYHCPAAVPAVSISLNEYALTRTPTTTSRKDTP